jgi:hypothetical protein
MMVAKIPEALGTSEIASWAAKAKKRRNNAKET